MTIRRFLCPLLILMLAALPALCEEPFILMGFEDESAQRDWSQSLFFPRMADRTGVAFTFRQYGDPAAYQRAKDEAFATGNLPDAFFKANLTPEEEMAYLKSGQLVDLAPYLDEYAPNLSAILNARPDWRAVITQPDGAIASLPALSGADRQCCVWINTAWLEALNLPMPTTIGEYTDVLRAFRDQDPNGNGKRDEIPLSVVGPWEAKFLLHAFGLVPNDYNLYVDDEGAVRFAPFEPGYRAFVAWLREALGEGLIDPDAFRQFQGGRTASLANTDENAPAVLGGMISFAPYALVDMDSTVDYAVLPPLVHEGKQVYRRLLNGVGRGTFAVTSACGDVPALLGWADYLYSEAGGRLAFAGLEGEDYAILSDGKWQWDGGEEYLRLTEISENSIIAGDGRTPGLEPAAFLRNSQIAADVHARRQTDTLQDYLREPFPVLWPADEAVEARIAELQQGLAAAVDTAVANFAMGLVDLTDETWAAFEEELAALGAKEFTALWQAKYDGR